MPLYIVEDQYVDPAPPTDAWAAFLAARFSKRAELYRGFSDHEREMVKKELRRIKHLRDFFEEHRLSATDASSLLRSLERAHDTWRNRANRVCKEELHRIEVGIARASGYRRQELNRQRLVLKRVEQWPMLEYSDLQKAVAPENYIPDLNALEDGLDDNPAEPNYGYNGWVAAFNKGQGGVTLDHPLCHGKFPHQKISMQKLLYDEAQTPLKRSADRTQLRYFHLQANNMKWVEVCIGDFTGPYKRFPSADLGTRTQSRDTTGRTAHSWTRRKGYPNEGSTSQAPRRRSRTPRSS
jgi:hypothetical protein